MKALILCCIISATIFGCTNKNDQTKNTASVIDSATTKPGVDTGELKASTSINEMVSAYLNLKNALASDNGKDAAIAGKQMSDALAEIDHTSLAVAEEKVFAVVKDDVKEHAEHITSNEGKIEHQRKHFDLLSKDMYDLVKVIKPSQTLYVAYCPMYNNKKGATWLSEVKEIKNPYYGKEMLECGEVKEEIK